MLYNWIYFINKQLKSFDKFMIGAGKLKRIIMGTFVRSTRECSISQLRPELLRAMQNYFTTHGLGDPETEITRCCETFTEKKATGWLSSWLNTGTDSRLYTGMVLTTRSLIWARAGDITGVHVVGAELKNIRARGRLSLFSKNFGLEVIGLVEDSTNNVRGIIGMGPEPAAEKFCDEVHQAIEKINPTPTRKWPAWMGGA
ncbi:MAG TPA: hypothetical protein VGK00_06360 [Anaerolineales bacterium]|jgi:hypothetical protein